jgi:hypothetical protein
LQSIRNHGRLSRVSRSLALLLVLLTTQSTFAARRRASAPSLFPPCTVVNGTPAVTFSRDGGKSLATTAQRLQGVAYTFGVAALDAMTLLSIQNTTLSISTDAGCTWRVVGEVAFSDPLPPFITAAGRARAYIWSDSRENLARYANGTIKILKPPIDIVGLGVDRASVDHIRIAGGGGSLWESFDGGDSWQFVARPPAENEFAYRASFDPSNLDHVVWGFASNAASVTFDGGRTYTTAGGFAMPANVFSVAISPADPNTVWAMAINIKEADTHPPSQGRHMYLSRDGGVTFAPVIDAGPTVTLINGPLIAPHPTDPNVLYFVFGTYFGKYGTDLFRYDAASRVLTVNHFQYDDFDAIVFSPIDPNVMYFGLEVVQLSQP